MTQPTLREETETLYCYNHPQRETMLRCNRCERPICNSCAVLTPTGYRCVECVRGQQKIFNTARPLDYVLAVVVAFALSLLGSFIARFIGFFIFFVAPIVGIIIAEVVRLVVNRRRSRLLWQLATAAAVLGSLVLPSMTLLSMLAFGRFSLLGLLWPLVYTLLVASSVFYRLSGIQIR